MSDPLLRLDALCLRFGGQVILDNVSFSVPQSGIVGLIGPNGAGKTSVFNCISRTYQQQSGTIVFDGRALDALRPHEVARLGIARTFQNVELLRRESVLDNVLLGCHQRLGYSWPEAITGLGRYGRLERSERSVAYQLLERFGLLERAEMTVGALPYAQQKLVEIARCLAARPRLMLLDEPVAGLQASEREEIVGVLHTLRADDGVTLVVVEHDVLFVRSLADSLVALDFGRMIASGGADEVLNHRAVLEAYLGVGV